MTRFLKKDKAPAIWLFLIGLGMYTRLYIIGALAISELAMFVLAPFLLYRNWPSLKREGFLPFFFFPLAMILGCFISCIVNGMTLYIWVKRASIFYSVFASTLMIYLLLRKNPAYIGWFALGMFLSSIISVFVFQVSLTVTETGSVANDVLSVDEQMEGVLFWYPKVKALFMVIIAFGYAYLPVIFSSFLMVGSGALAALISVSGRGAAGLGILAGFVYLCAGRTSQSISRIGRYVAVYTVAGILAIFVIKQAYVYSAEKGLLGEDARNKYFAQSRGKSGLLAILMGGRTEFFIAIRAMMDHPIIGIGPLAIDREGYVLHFLEKYGEESDFKLREIALRKNGGLELIPQHSSLTQFWGEAGISGLLFWVYVLWMMYKYFTKWASMMPRAFGYMAALTLGNVFFIFFNPYYRPIFPAMFAILVLSRALYKRRIYIPEEYL